MIMSIILQAAMLFPLVRPANPADGKFLTPRDAVNNKCLDPSVTKDYFKDAAQAGYPRLVSRKGSLWRLDCATDSTLIAKGGNGIVFGAEVSRHEFGTTDNGIFPSPDGTMVAFYKKDESAVAFFPYLDISKKNGGLRQVRYPMNGCASEKISLGVYDFATGGKVYLKVKSFGADRYLCGVGWNDESTEIFVQVLDRDQQNMRLCRFDPVNGECLGVVLEEHSDTWVEPRESLRSVGGGRYIYTTDNRDGWWNLYVVDMKDNSIRRLAQVDADMEYAGFDGRDVYYTAADGDAVNNYLWKASLRTGKVTLVTTEPGWHRIDMAPDGKTFVDVYESIDRAPESRLVDSRSGKVLKVLKPSVDVTAGWAYPGIELGKCPGGDGISHNYYRLVKPVGFDPSKKYPLILYVYGGPHSQMVRNSFLASYRKWEILAAQAGFAVLVVDGRGTQRRGTAYAHSICRQCGVCESADQMKAIEMAKAWPWVDAERIGVYGWSYGGFMSLTLATGHPDVFKVCVAGGPVIDWRWYEVMYGERYMGRDRDNHEGMEASSLLGKAASLRAKTLVIQGALDDTVVPLHAESFVQKCSDCSVAVDFFVYPKAAHNMRGKDRVDLMRRVTDWFVENL